MNVRRKQQKNAQAVPVAPADFTRGNIIMLFQKQMRPAFRTIDKGGEMGYIKATPHNSAVRLALSFPPSAACRFLDLPPVNLRNLHLHLTKNPFAGQPPHLCGVALIPSFDEEIGRAPDRIAKRRLSRPCRAWSLAAPAPGMQRASACCCRKIARREAVRAQRIIDAARRCSSEGRIAGLQFAKQRVPERCTERSVESMTLKECIYDYQRTAFWNYLCRCRR